jgi:hypothetical protein
MVRPRLPVLRGTSSLALATAMSANESEELARVADRFEALVERVHALDRLGHTSVHETQVTPHGC